MTHDWSDLRSALEVAESREGSPNALRDVICTSSWRGNVNAIMVINTVLLGALKLCSTSDEFSDNRSVRSVKSIEKGPTASKNALKFC